MVMAVRLRERGLALEDVERPVLGTREALVRVHAAGLTRDELTWPTDRLPATPSYELSGVIEEGGQGLAVGDPVFALTPFDLDGVASELAAVPVDVLAPKPAMLTHVEAAALPLAALSAWQALFEHGQLVRGERALITGATGGVGHLAVQLARWRGARVVAATSNPDLARELGADEILGEAPDEPVDLAFDTAGGDALTDAIARVRDGGRVVSVAEEPAGVPDGISSAYFVVGPNREQLVEIARLADDGGLRPMIDSVYALDDALAAFDRLEQRGKRGKVVLRIVDEG